MNISCNSAIPMLPIALLRGAKEQIQDQYKIAWNSIGNE